MLHPTSNSPFAASHTEAWPGASAADPSADPPLAPRDRGERLGPWELREPIGRGGSAEVWRAVRCDGRYAADAAVKLLPGAGMRPGAGEAELLGRLEHPHIARLLDAGNAADGACYLVLEYVRGEPIDAWCDARRLGLAARIGLFQQLCSAVAHAHTQLVVHRDLKPGNVLVDAEGRVKLLDFGGAQLQTGAEPARERDAGLTLEYAAPEQVSGVPVGTAADVYSLGVLLFRLLAGASPYGAVRHPAQLLRRIVHAPPLALPAAAAPAAAAARGMTITALRAALAGDLQSIVAKALEKRPGERYASVESLAADLRRHLAHEPVEARRAGALVHTRKFLRRNRGKLAALALVLGASGAGAAAALWQEGVALQEARRTRAVVDVLTELFTQLDPDRTGRAQLPVIELLQNSWGEARRRLAADPALLGEVAAPLGLMLHSAGDPERAGDALATALAHLAATGRSSGDTYRQVACALADVSLPRQSAGQAPQPRTPPCCDALDHPSCPPPAPR